jgi:steroid 5-alpha reductase family enzyme
MDAGMNEIIKMMSVGGVTLAVLFTITWAIQLRTKNAAIVDTVWSASFPVLAMVYFVLIDGYALRQLLVLGIVSIWGFRLAAYLYSRTIGKPEDVRYTALRKEWGVKQDIRMLRFYYFQAVVALLLSLPFALIMMNTTPSLNYYELAGAGVWLIAFIGESLSDDQLRRFKQDPSNKGKICDRGLWFYSRHPNYFFEWLVWVSYFIMALGSAWGFVTILCPLAMYYFLTRVTGIAYTEASMLTSRGLAYADYQKSTSSFFPLPKRKF